MSRDRQSVEIDRALEGARVELRRALTLRAITELLAGVAVAGWLGLVIDRALEPSPTWRLVAYGLLTLGAAWWLFGRGVPMLAKRFTRRELAEVVAARMPLGGDALVTAVQLEQDERAASLDEAALAVATMRAAEGALCAAGATPITRPALRGWPARTAIALGGFAAVFAMVWPAAALHYAERLALSSEPWPRRVKLVADGFAPDLMSGVAQRKVPRGAAVDVAVWADLAEGRVAPATVRARWRTATGDRQSAVLERLGAVVHRGEDALPAQQFRLRLDSVLEDTTLQLAGGDGRLGPLVLRAVDRPELTGLRLRYTPPAYLIASSVEVDALAAGSIPEGAIATLVVAASKPLSMVRVAGVGPSPETAREATPAGGAREVPVELGPLSATRLLHVELTDTDGIDSATPVEATLDVLADSPPTIELRPATSGRAVTRDARIDLAITTRDDHGVARAAVVVSVESRGERRTSVALRGHAASGRGDAAIDLLALRSEDPPLAVEPGDAVRLVAECNDAYDLSPREPSRSEPVTVEVVTPDELLARLAEREQELRAVLEGALGDVRRLAYALDLESRSRANASPDELGDRAAELLLDVRKGSRGVAGVAAGFHGLRDEVLANRIDQPALAQRLEGEVAVPLDAVVSGPLERVADRLDGRLDGGVSNAAIEAAARDAADAVARLERVLDRVESRASYNEVVSLLRGLIRDQRRVNAQTERERRDSVKRLLLE